MEKVTFSKHMVNDRTDRYVFIATKLGFGDVIFTTSTNTSEGAGTVNITSTGVIIVKGYKNTIITLYIATLSQIKQYYGRTMIPMELLKQVRRNEKRNLIVLQDKMGK